MLGIKIPKQAVCEQHGSPWRAFCDAYFARNPLSVWIASRGFGGKSFLLALLGWVEAVTQAADVVLLGGSGLQSVRIHEYMFQFWHRNPSMQKLLENDPSQWRTQLRNGAKIQALTASTRSVRGLHPQRLRIDEADEMELKILDAALGQPMGRKDVKSQIVISSTHQYPDGTMTEILNRARSNDWAVYRWCYRETSNPIDGWLSDEEIAVKRSHIPSTMWEWEYELQEPASKNRLFSQDLLDEIFVGEDWEQGALGEYIEMEAPDQSGIYVTAADWAKKKDHTIIVTIRIDVQPFRLVTFERRGREPWQLMIARLDYVNQRFKTFLSVHDGTGLGDVVNDYLKTASEPIILTEKTKRQLMAEAVARIQNKSIFFPKIRYLYDEIRYITAENVFGSEHTPDSFIAVALALHRATFGSRTGVFV